jgi:Transglycosylase SLT domain
VDHVSRSGHPLRSHAARRAATLSMVACVLVSCSSPQASEGEASHREAAPERATSASPTPDGQAKEGRAGSRSPRRAPAEGVGTLPRMPATHNAAALARQLNTATATLRARDAAAADVRRAGEFQQLAVHTLGTAPGALREKVTARLRPPAALVTRGAVRAARSLEAITSPEQTLPQWRIVTPAPPGRLLGHYHRAQRRTGVPWNYLAAIHLVETRMGRIRGTSTAGARGPMQFLPSTWAIYGDGGNINDPRDAILAAARLLKDNGAPGDMAHALWHYNPSDNYVRAVTAHARTMARTRFAYRGYWHWRVLYRHTRGTYVLPVGYPDVRPVLLPGR